MSAPWIEADWPAPPGVRAITTRRFGAGVSAAPFDSFNLGTRNGDQADAVAENRRQLAAMLELPSPPRWLRQVHGVDVANFDADVGAAIAGNEAASGRGYRRSCVGGVDEPAAPAATKHVTDAHEPEADAALTATPGTVLAILTADCLPLVFAARDGREIAAAHAGWRGLADGVIEATVNAMRSAPEQLQVWLGPAAGPAAYEVGSEVRDALLAHDARAESAFAPTRPGHWKVDLYALARRRLAALGIEQTAIFGGGRCTISEPEHFFSHRRDGRSGRIATLIWMTR